MSTEIGTKPNLPKWVGLKAVKDMHEKLRKDINNFLTHGVNSMLAEHLRPIMHSIQA